MQLANSGNFVVRSNPTGKESRSKRLLGEAAKRGCQERLLRGVYGAAASGIGGCASSRFRAAFPVFWGPAREKCTEVR